MSARNRDLTIPALRDFIATCREQFAFLESHFQFLLLPTPREYNAFSVRWRRGEFGVDVYGEGYGTSASCDLLIGESDVVSLGLLIPPSERSAPRPKKQRPDQLEQVRILAHLLQVHAADFLGGDRQRFDATLKEWRRVRAPQRQTPEDIVNKARRVAGTEAGHAFKRGDFAKVVQLLEWHEGHLSRRQRSMLIAARSKHRDADS